MTNWDAFFLGIIQGITEFLPISSSGHLTLFQHLLGFTDLEDYIFFNLVCHLGTLCAILIVFQSTLRQHLSIRSSLFQQVVIATLPLFPLVLILNPLKSLFNRPEILGPCFLFTACVLFFSQFFQYKREPSTQWKDPLMIGFLQAVAIFPGISRSGITISAAHVLGWEKQQAIQFSFLLAIPAILGGIILESWHLWNAVAVTPSSISFNAFLIAFFTSLVVGCFSLLLLIRLFIHDKWYYFGWYCLLLGTVATFYFNFSS